MSKSLNNFFTLQDIREKGFDPTAFRILALQAHYRTQLNFSWDNLTAAQNRLQGFYAMAVQQYQTHKGPAQPEYHQALANIIQMAQNDLDTPQILAEVSRVSKLVDTDGVSEQSLESFVQFLTGVDDVLGLDLAKQQNIASELNDLLQKRQKARAAKDWATTDALRDQLNALDIGVRDTANGQIWYKN